MKDWKEEIAMRRARFDLFVSWMSLLLLIGGAGMVATESYLVGGVCALTGAGGLIWATFDDMDGY